MADDYLDNILNPRRENSEILLARLGLDSVPSREQINREIEEKLLLTKGEASRRLACQITRCTSFDVSLIAPFSLTRSQTLGP